MFSADRLCRETEGEVFQESAIKKRNLCLICRRSVLREQTMAIPANAKLQDPSRCVRHDLANRVTCR